MYGYTPYHRFENEQVKMILAIVNRMEGTADTLTGEQLELDAGQLCVSSETADEKKKMICLWLPFAKKRVKRAK